MNNGIKSTSYHGPLREPHGGANHQAQLILAKGGSDRLVFHAVNDLASLASISAWPSLPSSLCIRKLHTMRLILDAFRDCKGQDELTHLWTTVRFVCHQFKAAIEDMFEAEHLPKTSIYIADGKTSIYVYICSFIHVAMIICQVYCAAASFYHLLHSYLRRSFFQASLLQTQVLLSLTHYKRSNFMTDIQLML